ncbi:hypothetical protein JCM3766R1_000598 [Sporobolomyces carnicolor]
MTRTSLVLLKSPREDSTSRRQDDDQLELSHVSLLSTSFDQTDLDHARDTLVSSESCDAIVFCSQRAVTAFERIKSTMTTTRRDWVHFAVGEQTRQALEALYRNEPVRPVILGHEGGNGHELAKHIRNHFSHSSIRANTTKTKKLLFLCGDKGTGALPKALSEQDALESQGGGGERETVRFELTKVRVYSTEPSQTFEQEFLDYLKSKASSSSTTVWIGICSPSGARVVVDVLESQHLLSLVAPSPPRSASTSAAMTTLSPRREVEDEAFRGLEGRLRIVVIGTTTEAFIRSLAAEDKGGGGGTSVAVRIDAVAEVPGEEGMIEAVKRATAGATSSNGRSDSSPDRETERI